MPDWPYGTQPKSGAPETISVGTAIIEGMLSPLPYPWLAVIIPLIDPTTITTAELCATEPGPAETWGLQDLMNGLDSAQHQAVIDKLIRMVKANLWPTYCEFTPVPPEDHAHPVTRTQSFAMQFSGVAAASPYYFEDAITPGRDMFALVVTCLQERTSGSVPSFHVVRPDDTESTNFATSWPSSPGLPTVWVITHDLEFDGPEGFPDETMEPNNGYWRLNLPASDGVWDIVLWEFDFGVAPRPDPVEPWPTALPEPTLPQFTEDQMLALNTMAAQWPNHKIGQELLDDMILSVDDHLESARAELVAMLDALSLRMYAPFDSQTENHQVNASGSFAVPAGVVGFYVYIDEAPNATVLGTSPEAWFEVGFVAQAWGEAWYESEPIKHNPTIFYPLKPGVESIWFDLYPETQVSFNWLVPA